MLFVIVEAPGSWFAEEIKRVCLSEKVQIAIVPGDPGILDESYYDYPVTIGGVSHLVYFKLSTPFNIDDYDQREKSRIGALRILARLETATAIEIASLLGKGRQYISKLLMELESRALVRSTSREKYFSWQITPKGLRFARFSWNVPFGMRFSKARREIRYSGFRHKHISRLWREWLKVAYDRWSNTGDFQILECWTETIVGRGFPDALAWVKINGREALIWLEVDSGHSSTEKLKELYRSRAKRAEQYGITSQIPIYFVVLSPRWVRNRLRIFLKDFTDSETIIPIMHDWNAFGELPALFIGQYGLETSYPERKHYLSSGKKLPFDPQKYSRRNKPNDDTPNY